MPNRLSRRAFLVTTGATTSVVAVGGLPSLLHAQAPPVPTSPPSASGPGYLALAPRVMQAGQSESVSLSLFQNDQPASGAATVSLVKDDQAAVVASGLVDGHGTLSFSLPPDLAEGDYQLRVDTLGLSDQAPIRVEQGAILFLETDKPIYKPGQTVHIRILALDSTLRPTRGDCVVEVADAKGTKIFKKSVAVDDFGMADLDLPLSTEPNLGVWKLKGAIGRRTAQLDVRVERYVLPKYEVSVDLNREWALASEPIAGTVSAQYSFGKPVKGDLEVVASRYVGTWQEYARVSAGLDGRGAFEIPAVGYAAGSPAGGGLAQVRLDVTVREQATGYEGQTSRLITIASSPVGLSVMPETSSFKPGLPLSLLVLAQSPDRKPVDTGVTLVLSYRTRDFRSLSDETRQLSTRNGTATVKVTPPADAASVMIVPSAAGASGTPLSVQAGYSPSGSFVHVEQATPGPLKVGDTAHFNVSATRQSGTFYVEVLARGKVLYSDAVSGPDIAVDLTPLMAPAARLLVYQLVGGGEVAADFVPFTVQGNLPGSVAIALPDEVQPGQTVDVSVQTQGGARIGLAAVDRSVFILAENRLNLQQVFDELQRLYQQPQAEAHVDEPLGPPIRLPAPLPGPAAPGAPAGVAPLAPPLAFGGNNTQPGAKETFEGAGVVVLTNRQVPAGLSSAPLPMAAPAAAGAAPRAAVPAEAADAPATADAGLAEVQRIRQFFPETWVWSTLATDGAGRATQHLTAPDSITTWMFRAVSLSKEQGLGIGEAQLRVFQPFFVQLDLPYSAIRGETLPAQVALYNYLATPQDFVVDLDPGDGFDLLEDSRKTVTVGPNNVGGLAFQVRPTGLGSKSLKATARSGQAADAIVKLLLVEPEGVSREVVQNLLLTAGAGRTVDLASPATAVDGLTRATIALTGNVLSQTIDGLESLLQMPFGCGEQNMILFAPNVFVARYLKETSQLKPEVMAKAELLMLTGYQRELVYRRSDASFSAFGQSDAQGSLWLTAFVLKTFAQARDLIYIDDTLLGGAGGWIRAHQNADGSFDPVGFLHHQDLLGGLRGKTALTAYVATALLESGDPAAGPAVGYLERQLDGASDVYTLALSAYALALAKSGRAADAHDWLMATAHESDEGLWWGDPRPLPLDLPSSGMPIPPRPQLERSAAIETTGYATLALLAQRDLANVGRASRWLASKRNAYGGFGSTQDTVVALQAMATAASVTRADIDATVTLRAGDWTKEVRVSPDNADVLQVVELPVGTPSVSVQADGRGQVLAQAVLRFNLPAAQPGADSAIKIDVRYGADHVAVNDLLDISAAVAFAPPEPIPAGMVVLDVAMPTGFAAVAETLDALRQSQPKLKRWDEAGRKVVFFLEEMQPGEQVALSFQARALFPVRAQAVASLAYAYYRPEWAGESLGGAVVVSP